MKRKRSYTGIDPPKPTCDEIKEAFEMLMASAGSEDFENSIIEEFGSERAHVDFDEYTEREWNKIMDIEDAPHDTREEEFWKEEREKFSKIADSFITTMNSIQGSRELSEWNGSVLDSVVGAFLTQNSADSVTSSAFMNLISKYPASNQCTGKGRMKLRSDEKLKDKKLKDKEKTEWYEIRKSCTPAGPRPLERRDCVDWNAVRTAEWEDIAEVIASRGQQNNIAKRIQAFLNAEMEENGELDLEWLRNARDKHVREYLLRIFGIGLKSIECVRLLELMHPAFPVDTNVARVATRLGWISLAPLSIELDRLEEFPSVKSIHKYLWPRLCKLDQRKLFQFHYHLITFGKVFCRMTNPNCSQCPLKDDCKYFASVSARGEPNHTPTESSAPLNEDQLIAMTLEHYDKPTILRQLRTIHNAYVLEDGHPFLKKFKKRVSNDPCPYILAIRIPSSSNKMNGDRADHDWQKDIEGTIMIPCQTAVDGSFPLSGTYFQPNEVFADYQTSQNPILVSRKELHNLERAKAPLYCCGTTSSIFKGMPTTEIQLCFSGGFICSRVFNRKTRAPMPLPGRFQNVGASRPNTFKDWYEFNNGMSQKDVDLKSLD